MKPHKHAELIKAWADGAEIQLKGRNGEWIDIFPDWQEECEYRIKHEPKPDVVWFVTAYLDQFKYQEVPQLTDIGQKGSALNNLKLTFDGETGELKSAEVLK